MVVLSAVLVLAWMLFLPSLVERLVEQRTGFEMQVESLSVNPFSGRMRLRGLLLKNPEGYREKEFVQVREIFVDAELFSLLSDRLVVDEAVVDVAKVVLVKDKNGKSNFSLLEDRIAGRSGGEKGGAPSASSAELKAGSGSTAPPKQTFLIRQLRVRFDKLVTVDESGSKPTVRELSLNFNQGYQNVTSPLQIALPIADKVSALGGALGDFGGKLGIQAMSSAKKAGEIIKETGIKTGEAIKGFFKSLTDKKKD